MVNNITNTAYHPEMSGEICRLWTETLGEHFKLTERLWRQNTAGDPDFKLSDIILALSPTGQLAGMALTKQWSAATLSANQALAKYQNDGYLSALLVHPTFQHEGLGRRLLGAAENQLWQTGVSRILLGQSFCHFFPGLPANLKGAQPFFENAGYTFSGIEYDLDGVLAQAIYEPLLLNGSQYRQAQPDDQAPLLAFLDEVFPGRWAYTARLAIEQGMPLEDFSLLLDHNENIQGFLMTYPYGCRVVGPSVYWLSEKPDWGGIGPLGISPIVRGKGSGLGLVAAGMRYLNSKGLYNARIDWTTLVDFYAKLGFQPSITYLQAHKFKK